MLKNNNLAVIHKMAVTSLKTGRRRSVSMILAVFLSSFMLLSVLTVGVTFFKMQRLQNIRISGADHDAIVYGITDEQMAICRDNPDIKRYGVAAVSGYVAETEQQTVSHVGLIWADETYWDYMMKPARKWVKGRYPVQENEVMVTERALEKCGLEGLDVGDCFTVTYGIGEKKIEKTFYISGIWDGYGPKSIFYVSEAFYRQTGLHPSDVSSGRCYIDFRQNLMSPKKQEAFITAMKLAETQRLLFTGDFTHSMQILAGIAGLVLITCLCAYLLIYNIMYLAVAGKIRYYGLLQTIGMTGRQIRRLVYRQMFLIGGIGTAGGLLAGSIVSFFLIPFVIKTLGIQSQKASEITVTFHPAIFLLTVILTGATVYTAARKPAKTAVSYSPMEALGYRPQAGKTIRRTAKKGPLIWRLAKRQLTKDPKKSGIVMLSLATSMSVFLCLTTLITSQGAREFVYNYRNLDLVLKNDTLMQKEKENRIQVFDQSLLQELQSIEGVDDVDPVLCTEITVPWEPDFADFWMRKFYKTWMTIPYEEEIKNYQAHPEQFGSALAGISRADFQALNESLETPIDEAAFLSGKTCLLYRNGLNIKNSDITGKTVTCAQYDAPGTVRTFQIAGLTDVADYTAISGYTPVIIASRQVVEELTGHPILYKLGIQYDEEYDEKTEKDILSTVKNHTNAFSYESKIELMKNVKDAQGNMMEVGIGIVVILALIGVTNYINTLAGSIQSRSVEISILESIGMTGSQIKRMLTAEGILYAGGALVITGTIGTAVTYLLFQSMNYRGAPFKIPLLPALGSLVLILLICTFIPAGAWRQIERKRTVTERIKGIE